MKYVSGFAAIVCALVAAATGVPVHAQGYGCTSCGGSAGYAPCCQGQTTCQSCQPTTVQHVHVHKSLFGHHHGHHAPIMMPMVAPMVQVPMAMTAVAATPVAAERFVVAEPRTLVLDRSATILDRSLLLDRALTADRSLLLGDADRSLSLTVRDDRSVDAGAEARMRAMLDEARSIRDAAASRDRSAQTEIETLRQEVRALDEKFEQLKLCIRNCIDAN